MKTGAVKKAVKDARPRREGLPGPVRKVYYNTTVTSLSVTVALMIGIVELLQATVGLRVLDLGKIGYLVVALFFATWAVSLVYWKAGRVEERWTV